MAGAGGGPGSGGVAAYHAAMPNPVSSILATGRPFTYFHTHAFTAETLSLALKVGRSLEIDISMDDAGKLYVGHPTSFYDFKGVPMPANLPLEAILDAVEHSDIFTVFDCKDVRALPAVRGFIERLGPERTLFHSWVDALLFEPYPSSLVREPHWPLEDLPLEAVAELGSSTGVPLMLSARGLTLQRLAGPEREEILSRICAVAAHSVVAVSLTLPGLIPPPRSVSEVMLRAGVVPVAHVDLVEEEELPELYLGVTDDLRRATALPARRSQPSGPTPGDAVA